MNNNIKKIILGTCIIVLGGYFYLIYKNKKGNE